MDIDYTMFCWASPVLKWHVEWVWKKHKSCRKIFLVPHQISLISQAVLEQHLVTSGDQLLSSGNKENIASRTPRRAPLWDLTENSLTTMYLSLFHFLCGIELYGFELELYFHWALWLNSECLNSSVEPKHQSFNGSAWWLHLTLAASSDMDSNFLVYFV